MIKVSSNHGGGGAKTKAGGVADKSASVAGQSTGTGIVAHFGADSVKMIAESIGIANLADDAARLIADDITMKLKCIAQDAQKFAIHGRRTMVTHADIDHSLKNKNVPPMFGYTDKELLPFRFASGGGRELYFQDEKEVDLADILGMSPLAKLPQDVALKCHWLSIEGIQPAIPENPPPLSKDRLRLEGIDPSMVLKLQNMTPASANKFITQKPKKVVETIKVKQYATHELSMEQQLYYKEITEACVGSDESRRAEALQSLTYDSGLHQMLPRLCTFISEGVKVNVVQYNLALLIYLMRMVKALMDNHNLYLEKYLHELIPTVLTCIVSKQLCQRPEQDNHWALRDFGSRLLAHIARNFNTNTNNIQVRITQMLSQALDKERIALSSLYGVIACFCEMGPEVQRAFLLKRLKSIGDRIRTNVESMNVSSADKAAAGHIESLILRVLPPTLKNLRSQPDIVEEYQNEFGYLGPQLHMAVMNLRSKDQSTASGFTAGSQQHRIISGSIQTVGTPGNFRRIATGPQTKYTIITSSSANSGVSPSPSAVGTSSSTGNVTMLRMITTQSSNVATGPTIQTTSRTGYINIQTVSSQPHQQQQPQQPPPAPTSSSSYHPSSGSQ